jgi:hypothetical protein
VWLAAALMLWAGCTPRSASPGELAHYRALRGELATSDTSYAGRWHGYTVYRVRLTSSTGLTITGRLLRPAAGAGPFPAVLLEDGREFNSSVIDFLPPRFGDVIVLALDYPPELPYTLQLPELLRHQRDVMRAARTIPALFSLGGMYLAQRRDVDSARIAVAATSFAVPFAVIAAAMDQRFRDVALVYGAGDFTRILAANLTVRPRALREPLAWLLTRPAAELEPTRFAPWIAPRPLVMVNGIDDPQMPQSAVRELYDAARQPKTLIWLRTGHLMPEDSTLIRALVDTALDRLPVLRGTVATPPLASERTP